MIKAYWTRILLFVIAGAFVALVASMLMPKKYEAEVQMLVDQTQQNSPMMTSAQEESIVDLKEFFRPRNIATQVEELQSLGVVTAAAKDVAARFDQPDPTQDPNSELNPINVQHNLNITADSSADIIDFTVRMRKPEWAQAMAEAIYTAFEKENETGAKALTQRAIEKVKAQSNIISKQLKSLDQQATELRKKTNTPDLTTEMTSQVSGLEQLKQARDTAVIEAAGAQKSVEVLAEQLAATPKMVQQGGSTTPNPIYQKLQEDLAQAESDRVVVLSQFLPGSDQLRAADEKIKSIKSQMQNVSKEIQAQTNTGLNQNYLALQAELATAKAASTAADQKVVAANAAVAQREQEVDNLPDVQNQLASLLRKQEASEKVYLNLQDILQTLQSAKEGRTSPTSEITPATVFPEPVSPKPLVNALFGAIVGFLLGVASMQFAEAKRQPVRSLGQLNGLAATPVYRIIPELREPFRGLNNAPPEPFESLILNYLRSSKRPYRIAVVGINKDSGASLTAMNIAIAAARHASKVLYVQCDPKGALARVGQKEPEPGHEVALSPQIKATSASTILDIKENHSGIAWSVTSKEADLTVVDLEPTTKSAEYAFVAPFVDEVILLVRAGRARSVEFLQAQQALRDAGCQKVTVVFTRSSDFSVVVDAIDPHAGGSAEAAIPAWLMPPTKEAPKPAEEPVLAPVAAPVAAKVAEPEPVVAPAPELKVETPEPADKNVIELPQEKMNGTEHEAPVRRSRSAPTVNIEDFGGIARAKMPEKKEEPAPESRPRRSKIDTSDIDS